MVAGSALGSRLMAAASSSPPHATSAPLSSVKDCHLSRLKVLGAALSRASSALFTFAFPISSTFLAHPPSNKNMLENIIQNFLLFLELDGLGRRREFSSTSRFPTRLTSSLISPHFPSYHSPLLLILFFHFIDYYRRGILTKWIESPRSVFSFVVVVQFLGVKFLQSAMFV